MSLFSSLGHLSVASWASQKPVSRSKLPGLPNRPGRAPGGEQDACAACEGGHPKHSSVARLPGFLVGTSILVHPCAFASVFPSTCLRAEARGPGLGLSVLPEAGHVCPRALASHVPGWGRGPWSPSQGQRDHTGVSPPTLIPTGTWVGTFSSQLKSTAVKYIQ